jgi:hypothetical protein
MFLSERQFGQRGLAVAFTDIESYFGAEVFADRCSDAAHGSTSIQARRRERTQRPEPRATEGQ